MTEKLMSFILRYYSSRKFEHPWSWFKDSGKAVMVGAHVITCKALLENLVNMHILFAVKRLLNRRNLKGKHEITQM
jgi:hypothetical protein